MNWENFCSPFSSHGTPASDEDIYQAVMDARNARENMEINGGDDIDTDAPVEPQPALHEVLQATSIIGRYIEECNDPDARKLESVLPSFRHQLHAVRLKSMASSTILDYFHRN